MTSNKPDFRGNQFVFFTSRNLVEYFNKAKAKKCTTLENQLIYIIYTHTHIYVCIHTYIRTHIYTYILYTHAQTLQFKDQGQQEKILCKACTLLKKNNSFRPTLLFLRLIEEGHVMRETVAWAHVHTLCNICRKKYIYILYICQLRGFHSDPLVSLLVVWSKHAIC